MNNGDVCFLSHRFRALLHADGSFCYKPCSSLLNQVFFTILPFYFLSLPPINFLFPLVFPRYFSQEWPGDLETSPSVLTHIKDAFSLLLLHKSHSAPIILTIHLSRSHECCPTLNQHAAQCSTCRAEPSHNKLVVALRDNEGSKTGQTKISTSFSFSQTTVIKLCLPPSWPIWQVFLFQKSRNKRRKMTPEVFYLLVRFKGMKERCTAMVCFSVSATQGVVLPCKTACISKELANKSGLAKHKYSFQVN